MISTEHSVPDDSKVLCYDHARFWVSNPKLTAFAYCALFGFEPYAYRGPENGFPERVMYVVRQGKIKFVFETALYADFKHINDHLIKHGESVRDVSFRVKNVEWLVDRARAEGVKIVNDVQTEIDESGFVKFASLQTFGGTIHTIFENSAFSGPYWPGFESLSFSGTVLDSLPKVGLETIDYCTVAAPYSEFEDATRWYEKVLFFHRYTDDMKVGSENSAFYSTVLANKEETIKIVFNKPINGKKAASQSQEFVDYNNGPGIQRIALSTANIIESVKALRARHAEFLDIPNDYYNKLRDRLKKANKIITEDLSELQKQKILVDFSEKGYVLQIFTKLCQDRPTFFFEIIQRHNYEGFGISNLKALYEAMENEQHLRGNLFYDVENVPRSVYKHIYGK